VPSWSPDGTQIAFTSNRAGVNEIWIMNTDGSNQKQLTKTVASGIIDEGSNGPSWSPDGKRIAFDSTRSGHFQIYTMNPDGSDVRQLTSPNLPDYPDNLLPNWSPDGKRIVFRTGIHRAFGHIFVMDADGKNRRRLTGCNTPRTCPEFALDDTPAWSPDGTQILYETAWKRSTKDPIETWVMDSSDGGNAHLLLPFTYGAGRLPWW